MIKSVLRSERGFLLLNVIFLMLITSFAAMILLNAATRARNPHATLRLTAIYLAQEQLAMLEDRAHSGEQISSGHEFFGEASDLKSYNFRKGEPPTKPIEFTVETQVSSSSSGNLRDATVIVTWKVGEQDCKLKAQRSIRCR